MSARSVMGVEITPEIAAAARAFVAGDRSEAVVEALGDLPEVATWHACATVGDKPRRRPPVRLWRCPEAMRRAYAVLPPKARAVLSRPR